MILDGYWKDRPSEAIKTGILADWSDALEDWQHEQVVYGLRKWRNENPSKKPNPGHILSILKAERGKAEVARAAMSKQDAPNVTPHKPTDAERRRMAEYAAAAGYHNLAVGFAPNRMPREQSEAQTQRNINAARQIGGES